ncbi:SH3 domain and tetratricopeptide repeat-containing protein 1 [Kryptolebias marmoratus]|uniref:SH3 domain and tetratricopeptide repeat-containing protein 1 n=1 Tax=Kryptolebias marmoratus TaxID=37003 RepID=UPI0007F9069A|nr:SH3 domain and tetratricopeptide repeat-containing protein 1 [Kryptolebias marmoratus]
MVLPVRLNVVRGPDHHPADEQFQDQLRGRLRLLESDSTEISLLLMELCAHLVSISSEEKVIFVTFKTFEEIWKFTTYYKIGIIGHCMEKLLLDPTVWLSSLVEEITVDVFIQEEPFNVFYRSILMQEGSFFASCSANQMFDSSTSGGDLYLEQGDLAQFEPPFLGSGWTVLSLMDGSRGTAPNPALEPVIPFYQWFLKTCAETVLVGGGKPDCGFPLQAARGVCLATAEYIAEGPDELSLAPGDRVIIVGFLVPCFDWFTGRMEATGEVGLVKTSLVKPCTKTFDSADIFLDGEDWKFSGQREQTIIEESIEKLKNKFQNDASHNYKLASFCGKTDTHQAERKKNIQMILTQVKQSSESEDCTVDNNGTQEGCKDLSPICFSVHPLEVRNKSTQDFIPLFSFLKGRDYREELGLVYGLSTEVLTSCTFTGHSDEDELIAFLDVARETAKKKQLFWTQTRLCYLLGKLCAGRSKFSQALVYFEESLCVPQEGFADLRLLASIYSNLAAVHALQKNRDRLFAVSERLVALLLGIPDCLKSLEESSPLTYMVKKSILSHNQKAEARACYLLAKHHWECAEGEQAVPYLERLLVACNAAQKSWSFSLSDGYLTLGGLYNELHLPHLSVSSAKRASLQPSVTLSDCLGSMILVLDIVDKHCGMSEQETSVLPLVAPYLHQGLVLTKVQEAGSMYNHVLRYQLTLCLCQLFYKNKMVKHAISYLQSFINNSPPSEPVPISVLEQNSALIWLAWLHIDNNQPCIALDILDSVLSSMPENCTTLQKGVVLNMRGVALGSMGDQLRAAENYQAAVNICQEDGDLPNWAVAQANLGLLCLKAGAKGLAQRYLVRAVQLFSELKEGGHEEEFASVLLELGLHYVKQELLDYGKGCYEWALLLAIKANLLDYQLSATRHLCHLYGRESPDQCQCLIYSQHQVHILSSIGDRAQEGDALEAISQLYLSLGTNRAYRAALDYTKSGLGIFIDLGCKEKEAYGWLKAGKIYHLLGQTELVDIYIQAAQEVALRTGDTGFILKLLEAAGDIFLNNCQDQDKALTFYRDRALPIAVRSSSPLTRLRLCNKLTAVMLGLKMYEEAVKVAQTAMEISVTLGDNLNERVACYRLASLYQGLEQYEMAEHYYLRCLTLCPTPLQFDEETLFYVRVYQTLGDITFYDLKDPFDAAGYYQLALAAAVDLGNKRSQLKLCTRLATIYHNFLVDRELSLYFYQKARGFTAELNVKRIDISPDQHLRRMSQIKTDAQMETPDMKTV